jgi:hypothetical protein
VDRPRPVRRGRPAHASRQGAAEPARPRPHPAHRHACAAAARREGDRGRPDLPESPPHRAVRRDAHQLRGPVRQHLAKSKVLYNRHAIAAVAAPSPRRRGSAQLIDVEYSRSRR